MTGNKNLVFVSKIIFSLIPFILISIQGINGQLREVREPDPVCAESPDSGVGQALIHQWYFNVEVAQCRELLYRGLGGNLNRFRSLGECEHRCLRHFVEGAERTGPKIKAAVSHKDNAERKVFSYRLGSLERKQDTVANEVNRRRQAVLNKLRQNRDQDDYPDPVDKYRRPRISQSVSSDYDD